MKFLESETIVPTKIIGPVRFSYNNVIDEAFVPIATFEKPLWHSTKRGMQLTHKSPINVCVIADVMTRSILLEASNISSAMDCRNWIENSRSEISEKVEQSSNFAKLSAIHIENIGRILFVRLSMETGNAAGHNITTKAADAVADLIISSCKNISYVSISGNYCTDKKNSSVNGILGRGKNVTAEIMVQRSVCELVLKTTPEKIVDLNMKKNFLGSIIAGSVRSANAHFANIISAIYLATGQDVANVVEASQGITFAEMQNENLYFSVTIPNIIVGTVGNGKNLEFAKKNMALMKCLPEDNMSSKRLSAIIASAVLCSEISLMAAQTNAGELMRSHIFLERPV
jgi:hydroxymethylglutaryl-CoA reductase (NADPH)